MTKLSSLPRPRVTLAQMLLLTAAIAAALAYHRAHHRLEKTRTAVLSMRSLARSLIVENPNQVAAITRHPTLPGEYLMDVYVPPQRAVERPWQLCLALEGILDFWPASANHALAPPVAQAPIMPGLHTVEIRHLEADVSKPESEHRIIVLLDGKQVIRVTRPQAWKSSGGWSSMGPAAETRTFEAGKRADLHRRRFHVPTARGGSTSVPAEQPATGIWLWIE